MHSVHGEHNERIWAECKKAFSPQGYARMIGDPLEDAEVEVVEVSAGKNKEEPRGQDEEQEDEKQRNKDVYA